MRRRAEAGFDIHGSEPGLYIEFTSRPGDALEHTRFENQRKGIELVSVTEISQDPEQEDSPRIQRATVFVPDGGLSHFFERFKEYGLETPRVKGERRNEAMLDPVAELRLATLRALWTDSPEVYPREDEGIWWEVWLRRHDDLELERFLEFCDVTGLRPGERRLAFEDRLVILAYGTPVQLSSSIDVLSDLAELRKAKETAGFFAGLPDEEQVEWAHDLQDRLAVPPPDAPTVCVLDTGVTRGHPLLEPVLAREDCHAVDPSWGPQDDGGGPDMEGHGTEMAGLALLGDLVPLLASPGAVPLSHRLESVKILPPWGANPPELYGSITAEAISRPEIEAPRRRRCFSLAITSKDNRDRGQPTSWSAAIDALAAGRSFDSSTQGLVFLDRGAQQRRLFAVSAGNVSNLDSQHLERSDAEPVHDPAQAWNALVVGAFTEKAVIVDSKLAGYSPVAVPGELSPYSTTSVVFSKKWPVRPDVVLEGGNTVLDPGGNVLAGADDLSLLTTYYKPTQRLFVPCWATSAAGAQAACMAAQISAEYPGFWPETIRALIVHSARWTQRMRGHLAGSSRKIDLETLLRRYGHGVPSLNRALRSAGDALTLVVQSDVRPFRNGTMFEMHLHELPWPKAALEALGDEPVTLRVTLSYFIEPNPGRRGWQKRHRYASHGLRFDVKQATEPLEDYRKRLNQRALDEDEDRPGSSNSSGWYFGPQARNRGSLHSDTWVGTAVDLAERGVIAVFPVTGWWKEQPKRDRSSHGVRYALVVSIETKAENVDLWTPVAAEVGMTVEPVVIET